MLSTEPLDASKCTMRALVDAGNEPLVRRLTSPSMRIPRRQWPYAFTGNDDDIAPILAVVAAAKPIAPATRVAISLDRASVTTERGATLLTSIGETLRTYASSRIDRQRALVVALPTPESLVIGVYRDREAFMYIVRVRVRRVRSRASSAAEHALLALSSPSPSGRLVTRAVLDTAANEHPIAGEEQTHEFLETLGACVGIEDAQQLTPERHRARAERIAHELGAALELGHLLAPVLGFSPYTDYFRSADGRAHIGATALVREYSEGRVVPRTRRATLIVRLAYVFVHGVADATLEETRARFDTRRALLAQGTCRGARAHSEHSDDDVVIADESTSMRRSLDDNDDDSYLLDRWSPPPSRPPSSPPRLHRARILRVVDSDSDDTETSEYVVS